MAKVIDIDPKQADIAMITGEAAIWYPEKPVRPERLMQNLQTLTFLLEDDSSRQLVCGPGNWALNAMSDEVEYDRKPLAARDYTRVRIELERIRGDTGKPLHFADSDVRAVARMLATRRQYSPVCEYLDGLPPWRGGDYIEQLGQALGLTTEQHGLELEFLKRWLISAVARAYEPGCQADTVLVLQGTEGQYKSRFFEELGGRWFVRMSAELGSRDSIEVMRCAWIVELDELDAMKRSKEWSTVKAAITRPTDDYVPKYIREKQKVPRRSVLAGTVNDVECLVDEEGLRRFWIISVKQRINRDWVRANRDGVWAQALACYRMKEQWHLELEHEELQRTHVRQFVEEHPWHELIEDFLEDRQRHLFEDVVTMQEIFAKALNGIEPAQQNKGNRKTVATILRRLGWARAVAGPNFGRKRGWKKVSDGE